MSTNAAKKLSPEESTKRKPFVKWAGGKSQILPQLIARLPEKFGTYFEPFVGGGALFFAISPERAVLSDLNPELINAYVMVRDNVEAIIRELKKLRYEEEMYYEWRNADRALNFSRWSPVRRAVRFLYLNRICFNGLYRVNSRGEFNVPFGRYSNPVICQAEILRSCSEALQGQTIEESSFENILVSVKKGDFVYLDPPYIPVSKTANFTSYVAGGFDESLQKRLSEFCRTLDSLGVHFLLSNAHHETIEELYDGFQIEKILARRAINSKGAKRGEVSEVLVRNY